MKSLVQKAKRGDSEAFIELMESQKESMYKVARSYLNCEADIADAMQQTILDCFEKLDTLRQPRYFKTWLIRILINNCNTILRENKRTQPLYYMEELESENPKTDLLEFLDLLDRVDEKYRTVLILYYVEGLKIKEIAEILNCNENTVNSQLRRGRMCYKTIWEKSVC